MLLARDALLIECLVFMISFTLPAAGTESRAPARALPRIEASPNGRFLITENGMPFFWLGDTGWWMTGISPAEVDVYLAKRAAQQFNVIQFHCGRMVKDYAGRLPFRDNDPLAPDEEYWRNVDSIVSKAGAHGLYIALVPLWGEEYGRLFGSDAERSGKFGQWIGAGTPRVRTCSGSPAASMIPSTDSESPSRPLKRLCSPPPLVESTGQRAAGSSSPFTPVSRALRLPTSTTSPG